MTRKQRQLVIEALRKIKVSCEEGERLAKLVQPLDIGALDPERTVAIFKLQQQLTSIAEAAGITRDALAEHIGATAILDRAKYPRAKPLSASRERVERRLRPHPFDGKPSR